MMTFSSTFVEARAKFRAASEASGAELQTFYHPMAGPCGEPLTTDFAWLGPQRAAKRLILLSGTHGAEGLAGSACQTDCLRDPAMSRLPDDTAILMIHMINPWGAAWRRRQTEGNVDLNRNFIDFAAPLPENRPYDALRDRLAHAREAGLDAVVAAAEDFRAEAGENAFATAIFQVQYVDPNGPGYGGGEPVWSNKLLLRDLIAVCADGAERTILIDIHTGLGDYARGVMISTAAADSAELTTSKRWFGPDVAALKAPGVDLPYDVRGDLCGAMRAALGPSLLAVMALEFGTYDLHRFARLQIADCWLEAHGDPASHDGQKIREALQAFFYPAAQDWRDAVLVRAREVTRQALTAFAA